MDQPNSVRLSVGKMTVWLLRELILAIQGEQLAERGGQAVPVFPACWTAR